MPRPKTKRLRSNVAISASRVLAQTRACVEESAQAFLLLRGGFECDAEIGDEQRVLARAGFLVRLPEQR